LFVCSLVGLLRPWLIQPTAYNNQIACGNLLNHVPL